MKVSVKQLVMLFLGLFLLKIAVADPYRENKKVMTHRIPAAIETTSSHTGV